MPDSIISEYRGALDKGLEGVVACSTAISTIAGTTLLYRGYTIEDLAENATFEEVAFLLWFGRLPKADELERFERELRAAMPLPPE
jgi:citrate synthase